jgi:hypothetical protein
MKLQNLRAFGSVASLNTIFTHMRDIRVVRTPFTTRYEIPIAERVESLIHMEQKAGNMILVFSNSPVKDNLWIDIRDGTCGATYAKQQKEVVGGSQERREDYRVYEAVTTQLLL